LASNQAPDTAAGERRNGAADQHADGERAEYESGRLTELEQRASGIVSRAVLGAYARAAGGAPVFASLLALYVLTEGVRVASSVWLSVWTSDGDSPGARGAHELLLGFWRDAESGHRVVGRHRTPMFYLGVYCAICFGQVRVRPCCVRSGTTREAHQALL
jgi:hypothetical protein